jgi:hypothetical protein
MAFKTFVDTGPCPPEMTFVRLAKGAWNEGIWDQVSHALVPALLYCPPVPAIDDGSAHASN